MNAICDLTLWTFNKERNTLLRELPPHLVSALHCELFQVAVRALMQALRSPVDLGHTTKS